jgi:DNA-directed RNA polymerase
MVEAGIIRFSMIHDSYGCPAPYVDIMNNLIREEFLKMHKENQLETFKRCVEATTGVTLPDVPDRGSMELGRVLDSQYFFS